MSDSYEDLPPGLIHLRILNKAVRTLPTWFAYQFKGVLFRKTLSTGVGIETPATHTFEIASQKDMHFISQHPEALGPPGVYQIRLAKGHLCYCFKHGDEVISYIWLASKSCFHLCGLKGEFSFFPLNEDQLLTYDLYVYNKYRGSRIGKKTIEFLAHTASKTGLISELYGLIMHYNTKSLQIHLDLGYQPETLIYGYRVGALSKVIYGEKLDSKNLETWYSNRVIQA